MRNQKINPPAGIKYLSEAEQKEWNLTEAEWRKLLVQLENGIKTIEAMQRQIKGLPPSSP